MAKMHGVSCHDGNVALYFRETADRCGVMVTLVVGEKALTAHIEPDAWNELMDRYGGPLSSIECRQEPDVATPEAYQDLKRSLQQAETSLDYYRKQAGEFTERQQAAARAPLLEENQKLRDAIVAQQAVVADLKAELIAAQEVQTARIPRRFEPDPRD